MKLLVETIQQDIKIIKEDVDKKKPSYYIEGIFMQADCENKNQRIYPLEIIVREVDNYNRNYVRQNRALGELCHPESPHVNLERVSHLIKSLVLNGNDVYGKAKLMDTPFGKIAKNLVDEGVKLGVSTRGVGSLRERTSGIKEVQDDFQLNAIDIVADPSAPEAFVEAIMENREWVYENGVLKAKQIEEYKKEIQTTKKRNIEKKILNIFDDFIGKLK